MSEMMAGGCLCGLVRYEIVPGNFLELICHCRMCQKQSGAPLTGVMFVDLENLQVTSGTARIYQSSARGERSFCGNCGSPMFWQPFGSHRRAVFVGSLDDPNAFRPAYHICTSGAVSWLHVEDDLPRYPEKPPEMRPTLSYDSVTGKAVERDLA